jgi:hypothetical protein
MPQSCVGRFLVISVDGVCLDKPRAGQLHNLGLGDPRIEGPVEIGQGFHDGVLLIGPPGVG